jgi:hypothetical protein
VNKPSLKPAPGAGPGALLAALIRAVLRLLIGAAAIAILLAPLATPPAGATIPPVIGTPVSCDNPCIKKTWIPLVIVDDPNILGSVEGQDQ